MADLAKLILLGLLVSPLLLGVFAVFFKALRKNEVWYVALGGWGAALLGLLSLGEMTFGTSLSFFNEPLSFSISTTAIWLCLALLVVLGLMLFLPRIGVKTSLSRIHFLLLNLALSCGFLAFFSNQFMLRYMALEGVGLLAALTVLDAFSEAAFKRFGRIFLMLRIGDLGLLAAILMILPVANTLEISEMLRVAAEMPLAQRTWVALGFGAAVLVKMAVGPFGVWLRSAKSAAKPVFWVTDFLMPALGMYLLYRVRPILQSHNLLRMAFFIAAAGLVLGVALFGYFRRSRYDRLLHLGSAVQGFTFMSAVFASGTTLRYYFVGVLVLRLGLYYLDRKVLPRASKRLSFLFLMLNLTILIPQWGDQPLAFGLSWVLLTAVIFGWDLWMLRQPRVEETVEAGRGDWLAPLARISEGLYQGLEITSFQAGTIRLGRAFDAVAGWFQAAVEGGLERLWAELGKLLMTVSERILTRVELDPEVQSEQWVGAALEVIDAREQKSQARPFRQDLIWIPLLLVLIICFLIISQRG